MSQETTWVDFNAPAKLIEEADAVSEFLDVSRTRLLVDALREELDEIKSDQQFQRTVRDAYYEGRVSFDALRSLVGSEEAHRVRLLRESLDRDPPEPATDDALSPAEVYETELAEWTPEE